MTRRGHEFDAIELVVATKGGTLAVFLSSPSRKEPVIKLMVGRHADPFVVPAQAGTQGFQSLALGPRFRGGDGFERARNWITDLKAGVQG